MSLTERQIKLLAAIIEEYIDSSEPVGSSSIVEKYKIDCSPATVRNEMARLLDLGFLGMLHTSSGRVPTTLAYKFFLDELMEEDDIPVLQEVAFKQKLWPNRFKFERLLREASISLSELSKELAFATLDDGFVVHAGAVNVLDYSEFWDIQVAKAALHMLDRYELLEKVLSRVASPKEVNVLIGEELGYENLENCAMVFSPYFANGKKGYIGVLGPARMHYTKVVPLVRHSSHVLQELGSAW